MSDFLSRLAERALGTNVPVGPRLPSLFEPERPPFDAGTGPDGAGIGSLEALAPASAGTIPGLAETSPASRIGEPPHDRAGSSAPSAASLILATGPGGWASAPSAVHSTPASPLSTSESAGSPGTGRAAAGQPTPGLQSSVEVPARPYGGKRDAALPYPGGMGTERQARGPFPGDDKADAPALGGGTSREIEPPLPALLRLREDRRSASAGPLISPPGLLLPGGRAAGLTQAVRPARVSRAPDRYQTGETPGPDPVVNITIGRIEVRAVPASHGERRTEPAPRGRPGPLSLDEYLRRREERR